MAKPLTSGAIPAERPTLRLFVGDSKDRFDGHPWARVLFLGVVPKRGTDHFGVVALEQSHLDQLAADGFTLDADGYLYNWAGAPVYRRPNGPTFHYSYQIPTRTAEGQALLRSVLDHAAAVTAAVRGSAAANAAQKALALDHGVTTAAEKLDDDRAAGLHPWLAVEIHEGRELMREFSLLPAGE